MKTRLITSGVAIVLALAIIILGSFYSIVITIALSLVSVILCGEYLSARKLNKNLKLFLPCLLFALIIPLLSYIGGVKFMYLPLCITIFAFVLCLCVCAVIFHRSIPFDDVIFSAFGVLLISVSLSLMNIIVWSDVVLDEELNPTRPHTAFWIIICLGIPWIADSAAYFAGSYLGKHKLCPNISPKKTVEGAIGGVVAGTLFSMLFGLIFQLIYGNITVYYLTLMLVGFINSIVSIFGDLTFSLIKRSCKIKDFGSIMPGHGGLLDRFDSVLLCIPIVFIFSKIQYFFIVY